MPFPVIDHARQIKPIPTHTIDLPEEAEFPRWHYERTTIDAWNMVLYFERNLARVNTYRASSERHFRRLNSMVLLSLVEAFERFLKELASGCIDQVGRHVLDDRLNEFRPQGSSLAAHFEVGEQRSLGRALCESSTWLDCDQINRRFKKILADPFAEGKYQVFPPKTERYSLTEIVWQLRHSIVHNAGVVTRSDALKFQLLTRRSIGAPRLLWPTHADIWYVKLYLDEIVEEINDEVGARLDELMTTLLADNPGLFDAAEKAQSLANLFRRPSVVAGAHRNPI